MIRERKALNLYRQDAYAKINARNAILQRMITLRKRNSKDSEFKEKYSDLIQKSRKIRHVGPGNLDLQSLYLVGYNFLKQDPKASISKILSKYKDWQFDQDVDSFQKEDEPKKSKDKYLIKTKGGEAPKIYTKDTTKQAAVKPVWLITIKDAKGVDAGKINAKELFDNPGKSVLDGDAGTVLKLGMSYTDDKRTQVAAVQQRLVALSFLSDTSEIDGQYGPKTKKAVEKFQKKYNLEVDGQVGRQTATAFFSNSAQNHAKTIPITGKDSNNPYITTIIDNLTKDRSKSTNADYFEPINRELKLDDDKQRGIKESSIRILIRQALLTTKM